MIDFTSSPRNKFKAYGGANGNKINIIYEHESYMLKFPPKASRNQLMSYANSCISEYIAKLSRKALFVESACKKCFLVV